MRHALHTLRPAVSVNVPVAQAPHTMSLEDVAAVLVYLPARHGSRTLSHGALPPKEKVAPTSHVAQRRSAVAVPSTERPSPAGHMLHAAQVLAPATFVKAPAAQASQTISLEAVAADLMYCPATHVLRTSLHPVLPPAENVEPTVHAVHLRSVAAVPSSVLPSPDAHAAHATHAWLPGTALKVPDGHGAQVRSDEAPDPTVSYSPAWHAVIARHTRSALSVGATNVYWLLGHDVLCVLQSRSAIIVGARCSYSFAWQRSTAVQASPLLAPEKNLLSSHASQRRLVVLLPAWDMPEPAGHVRQAEHAVLPAAALKLPLVHSEHVRSAAAVAAVFSSCPAAQGVLTAAHASPLSVVENVDPVAQGAQWRFAKAEPAVDMPSPIPHVRHAAQALLPTCDLKCPAAQAAHVRSLCAVAACCTAYPAAHGVLTGRHAAASLVGE